MIVEGRVKSGVPNARDLAEDIAVRWLRTNYAAYRQTQKMHEKYNVVNRGEFGGGGEYVPQTGFGWSKAVVLAFLEEFMRPQNKKMVDRQRAGKKAFSCTGWRPKMHVIPTHTQQAPVLMTYEFQTLDSR